jgi:hypothetical protein
VFTGGERQAVVGLFLVKDLLRHTPDGSVSLGQLQMRPLPRWAGVGFKVYVWGLGLGQGWDSCTCSHCQGGWGWGGVGRGLMLMGRGIVP